MSPWFEAYLDQQVLEGTSSWSPEASPKRSSKILVTLQVESLVVIKNGGQQVPRSRGASADQGTGPRWLAGHRQDILHSEQRDAKT